MVKHVVKIKKLGKFERFLENKKAYLYKNSANQEQNDIEESKNLFGEKEEKELKEILWELLV